MIYDRTFERYKFAVDDGWRVQLEDPAARPFAYGMTCMPGRYQTWKRTLADVPLRHALYRPVPWEFQYDMECYIVFHWNELWQAEIAALEEIIEKTTSPSLRESSVAKLEAVRRDGPTGLPRHEHLLRASEIRWPTIKDQSGLWQGVAKRHEWTERIYRELLDPAWATTPVLGIFGGAAQGKTTMSAGIMLHLFSHFEGTREGAAAVISTINEDKMKLATWPAVTRMLESSADGISLYAGHELTRAGWTIGRKDVVHGVRVERAAEGSGQITGILLGAHADRKASTDKLTGAHRKEGKMLFIDETQSASDAPFYAIGNAMSTVPRGRAFFVFAMNFGTKYDTAGKNMQPIGGWNSIPVGTPVYESRTQTRLPACIIHLNNLESPGLTNPEMFHDLFTKEKLADQVPDPMALEVPAIRRMILGWFDTETQTGDGVLREQTQVVEQQDLEDNGVNPLVVLDPATVTSFTVLDTAPEMRDRNVCALFDRGWCPELGNNVFQPVAYSEMPALPRNAEMAAEYPKAFTLWVKDLLIKNQRDPLATVNYMDASHYGIFASHFKAENMPLQRMVYGAKPADPDGMKADGYGHVERAFKVTEVLFGHNTAVDRISLGAWLLRQHIKYHTVAGLDIKRIVASAITPMDQDMEFFKRTMHRVQDSKRGRLWKLGAKSIAGDGTKISPDWLDLWFMAAYYVALTFNDIPGIKGTREPLAAEGRDELVSAELRDPVYAAWMSALGPVPQEASIYDAILG